MSRGFQLGAQLGEVIDLAVVGDDVASVGCRHRLAGGFGQVDDGKAAVAKGYGAVVPLALAIGAAVNHRVRHALKDGRRHRCAVEIQDAANAAHAYASFLAMTVIPAGSTIWRSMVILASAHQARTSSGVWRCALVGANQS